MGVFPRTTVGGVSVSRMIIGTNWFLGWSHTSKAKDAYIKHNIRDRKKIADIIEVFNSRVVRSEDNRRAEDFAESRSLPKIVGSDAHTSLEIGRSWVEIESIETPSEFMASLRTPKMTCRRSPMIVHVQTKMLKIARGVFR